MKSERGDALLLIDDVQAAANQLTSGVRVPAKIVPAVTDVSERHTAQRRSPSPICHQPASTAPQKRHPNPRPHPSFSR